MIDTTDNAQAIQDNIRRRMTPAGRLRLAFEMSALTKGLAPLNPPPRKCQ